jgi:hypothetical protein
MKTFKAFKQGKLFVMKQQGDRIVTTIYDSKSPNIEESSAGKTVVLGPGSIVLWDKLCKKVDSVEYLC